MNTKSCTTLVLSITSILIATSLAAAEDQPSTKVFDKNNLVAWCIVPFDLAKRGPAARAEMLERLELTKLAYDWREQHVPTFEDEIRQMKKRDIEFFAFWGFHPAIEPLIQKHKITPQIWMTLREGKGSTQAEMVESAATKLLPMVEKTRSLGCQFGLYNHGNWGGEPENLIAVVKWLRANAKAGHVGIVYNLHHGHGHIADFAQVLGRMKPFLLCLNLNGMNDNADPKILPLGAGQHDRSLLETIAQSGYAGPIGVLDHRGDTDAEKSVKLNLDGLERLVHEIDAKRK